MSNETFMERVLREEIDRLTKELAEARKQKSDWHHMYQEAYDRAEQVEKGRDMMEKNYVLQINRYREVLERIDASWVDEHVRKIAREALGEEK